MSASHIVGGELSPELEARVQRFMNPPWLTPEALRWESMAAWCLARAHCRLLDLDEWERFRERRRIHPRAAQGVRRHVASGSYR